MRRFWEAATALLVLYAVLALLVLFELLPWVPRSPGEWVLVIVLGPPIYLVLGLIGEGALEWLEQKTFLGRISEWVERRTAGKRFS